MTGLVVIKFGGGLITEKGELCTPKTDVIDGLCDAVSTIHALGHQVIVIHGAGSFGHLKARSWNLSHGRQEEGWRPDEHLDLHDQDDAVKSVRRDMGELNALVVSSLNSHGIKTVVLPPRDWASGTGPDFSGSLDGFRVSDELVAVSFGDVVNVDGALEFGILSGDDIVYRIAMEMAVEHTLFAMGGAPGLMSSPPGEVDSALIDNWSHGDSIVSHHNDAIDITGGIELKLRRAASIASKVPNVWILDGECPGRLVEAVEGATPIGTRILPTNP